MRPFFFFSSGGGGRHCALSSRFTEPSFGRLFSPGYGSLCAQAPCSERVWRDGRGLDFRTFLFFENGVGRTVRSENRHERHLSDLMTICQTATPYKDSSVQVQCAVSTWDFQYKKGSCPMMGKTRRWALSLVQKHLLREQPEDNRRRRSERRGAIVPTPRDVMAHLVHGDAGAGQREHRRDSLRRAQRGARTKGERKERWMRDQNQRMNPTKTGMQSRYMK